MAKNIIFESLTTDIIKSESIWQGYLSINDNKNINNDLVNAIINNDNILVSVIYEDNSENELSITKKEVDTESALKSFNYEFDGGYTRTDNITNVAFSISSELTPVKFVFYIEEETPVMLKSGGLRSGNDSNDISKIKLSNTTYNIKDTTARADLLNKQDTLVSGTNIKTINNNSLLGSGNINIEGGSDYTAGDGIDITSDEISNTAGMYLGDDTTPGTNLIDADLLGGYAPSHYTVEKIIDSTSTSITLTRALNNKVYIYTQPLTSLTISDIEDGITDIIFKSGSTATNVTLPASVIVPANYEIKANKTYEFNIMNNLLLVGEW